MEIREWLRLSYARWAMIGMRILRRGLAMDLLEVVLEVVGIDARGYA
jgi:hypothetical protein